MSQDGTARPPRLSFRWYAFTWGQEECLRWGSDMTKTITAVFDGEVFRPTGPVDLKPNVRYQLTVDREAGATDSPTAWDVLAPIVGAVEGPEDWAAEHDHYIYGTPRRHGKPPA